MNRFVAPICALVFLTLAGGAFMYLYIDIQSSATVITVARDQIAAIAARDTFAKAAAKFVAETVPERAAVTSFETSVDGTASAIVLVEEAAKIAKVTATVGSATLTPLPEPHHERLDVTVSAEGTFAGAARFATVLESLPRGAYLKEADLEVTDKGWFGTYVVSFVKIKSP